MSAQNCAESVTHTDVSTLNVFQRLNVAYQVIADYEFVKDGYVVTRKPNPNKTDDKGDGYNYISIGQILNAVRQAHAKAGLVVIFGVPEYDIEKGEKRYAYMKKETKWDPDFHKYVQTGKETQWFSANGHIDVTIYGKDEDDCIQTTVPFEVQDNSDKLTNKILTNAQRSLYRTLYAIDGDDAQDPEAINNGGDYQPTEEVEPRKPDPFFDKKDDVPEFKLGEEIKNDPLGTVIPTEQEMAQFINVKGAMPAYKETVKGYKVSHNVMSAFELSYDEKVELYTLLIDMGAGQ